VRCWRDPKGLLFAGRWFLWNRRACCDEKNFDGSDENQIVVTINNLTRNYLEQASATQRIDWMKRHQF